MYQDGCACCILYYKVGHVHDKIGVEANIDDHEEETEHFLPGISSINIPIADSAERGDGPVQGVDIANPYAMFFKVGHLMADPGIRFRFIVGSQRVVYARYKMCRK